MSRKVRKRSGQKMPSNNMLNNMELSYSLLILENMLHYKGTIIIQLFGNWLNIQKTDDPPVCRQYFRLQIRKCSTLYDGKHKCVRTTSLKMLETYLIGQKLDGVGLAANRPSPISFTTLSKKKFDMCHMTCAK